MLVNADIPPYAQAGPHFNHEPRRHRKLLLKRKEIEELRTLLRTRPKTVVLCTHRHSLAGLRQLLPPEVRITREVRMGLADIPGVPKSLMRQLSRLMGETARNRLHVGVCLPGILNPTDTAQLAACDVGIVDAKLRRQVRSDTGNPLIQVKVGEIEYRIPIAVQRNRQFPVHGRQPHTFQIRAEHG